LGHVEFVSGFFGLFEDARDVQVVFVVSLVCFFLLSFSDVYVLYFFQGVFLALC